MRRFGHTRIGTGLVALALSAFAGCAAPEPPANPAWDTDVYPILRGSCLHCHGSEFSKTAAPWRFDVCNSGAFSSVELGVGEVGLGTLAIVMTGNLAMDIDNSAGRPKMPPPPAAPLSDYERQVLQNWIALAKKDANAACKKAGPNQKPSVKLVNWRKEGSTVWATLDVTDPDGDAVMGKATVGSGSTNLLFLGRKEVKIDNTSGDKLSVKVSDGWDLFEATLN